MRRFATALLGSTIALAACGVETAKFESAAVISDALPGDVIALRADGDVIEYISRRTGEIRSFSQQQTEQPAQGQTDTNVLATVDVSIEGEQRGLLGHTVIDGRRYAAWTEIDTLDLVVGEVTNGSLDRLVWAGTGTSSKAVGGHLEAQDGLIVLGLGSLTEWGRDNGSGAIVTLDPDGPAEQDPVVLSDGWNNPFAFTVLDNGTIWVADNAPDGSDLPVADRDGERIAQATGDAAGILEPPPQRAPSAIVQLPDGRLGVCGFLDNQMRAYEIADDSGALERAGTIGPCLSGATVLDDGTIVTSSLDGDTPALLTRAPS
ncbi:MAG: hypothetical protein ACI9N0_000947 [Ilumatobacter sp.]